MAICLDYQSVYRPREVSIASIRWQLVAAILLLVALVARITIKIESTRVGYSLAKEQQITMELDMERRELELQREVLLRPDNLIKAAMALGLRPLDSAQARKIRY